MESSFWGVPTTQWIAIGATAAALQAIITTLLVGVGLQQILDIRNQNRRWRTLDACDRYHQDAPLIDICQKLRKARDSDEFHKEPKKYRSEIIVLLNYLDGLAIGIYQGLYIDELARDHMQFIVKSHVQQYLKNGMPKTLDIETEAYKYLMALDQRWLIIGQPHFHPRGWIKRWRQS
jgi:hypothetical protein